ncbi:MAG: Xaa-Pro peptidase family protein [Sulfolobales archaeon]|nr:Xaa-Pro peptidase family protein [Sulfolobales archaeon]
MIRLNKLDELMESRKLDYIIICGQPNIAYLTNLVKPTGCLLIKGKDAGAEIITPLLEYERIFKQVRTDVIKVHPYSSYKVGYEEVITDPIGYVRGKISKADKVGIDLGYINYSIYNLVTGIHEKVVNISDDMQYMRCIKDESEIHLIETALRITEDALTKFVNEFFYGITELQAVGLLEKFMRDLGAEGVAFDTIVASGINTVYPHAVPSNKAVLENEHLIVDAGATYRSYSSDMTRTMLMGASSEVVKVFDVVEQALLAAEDYVAPYMKVSEVDGKVREVLRKYGVDKYFTHSSGHGLGLEVHEMPRIAQGVDMELKPGMVITLEPGVYIRGQYGIRIEDVVVITNSGRKILNKLSHRF